MPGNTTSGTARHCAMRWARWYFPELYELSTELMLSFSFDVLPLLRISKHVCALQSVLHLPVLLHTFPSSHQE
jgi:hypothetical protein